MSGQMDMLGTKTKTKRKIENDLNNEDEMERKCERVEVKPIADSDIETDKERTNTEDKVREEDDFKVYINEGEMERIHEWVKRMPDIETGGDLFGLWIDERTAVVQFVLGPGKGCRRTTTSFFQDTDYLKRTGEYLTEKYGLCNIGQWHSHHKIPLFVPSDGDCNTVCNNMPGLGMGRYIVFIANIRNTNIHVNCFLFGLRVGQEVPFQQGEFEKLPGESPFRLNKLVLKTTEDSAENLRDEVGFPKSTDENTETKMKNETENISQKTEADDETTHVDRKINDNIKRTSENDESPKIDDSKGSKLHIRQSGLLLRMEQIKRNENDNLHPCMNSKQEQLSTPDEEKESSHHAEFLQFEQEREQGSPVISQPKTVEEGCGDQNNITNTGSHAIISWICFQGLWEAIGDNLPCQSNRDRNMR